MVLLKMLSATVSVLGDASWRPLLLLVYVWTAYAGWQTYGWPGLIVAMILPGISQVICVLYLWQVGAPILANYDWALLCAITAWLASFCGNALWSWVESVNSRPAPELLLPMLPEEEQHSSEMAGEMTSVHMSNDLPAVASR
jgi:hypothetical protein